MADIFRAKGAGMTIAVQQAYLGYERGVLDR